MAEISTPAEQSATKSRRLPSLLVVLIVLAVGTIIGVFLGVRAGLGAYSLLTLLLTGAVALVFVNEYRKLPVASTTSTGEAGVEEPFEDPVEEADRLDQQHTPEPEVVAEVPASPPDGAMETTASETPN